MIMFPDVSKTVIDASFWRYGMRIGLTIPYSSKRELPTGFFSPLGVGFLFETDTFLQNPETLLTPAAPTIHELPSLNAPGPSSWESSFPMAIFVRNVPR